MLLAATVVCIIMVLNTTHLLPGASHRPALAVGGILYTLNYEADSSDGSCLALGTREEKSRVLKRQDNNHSQARHHPSSLLPLVSSN